jgi:hypothetical protein
MQEPGRLYFGFGRITFQSTSRLFPYTRQLEPIVFENRP